MTEFLDCLLPILTGDKSFNPERLDL